jgi:hypothetical protein
MQVVGRYLDGRVVKGSTTDFHPDRDEFHLTPPAGGDAERVPTQGMKALFFVRSLEGNPDRPDSREFPALNGVARTRLWLRFRDGERMAAWPVSPIQGKDGFWVLPTDRDSNLEKVYVFRRSLVEVLEGREALEASRIESNRIRRTKEQSAIRILSI